VTVQKEQGVQGLILGGRADPSVCGEVVQKGGDLMLTHERGMTTAVEKHKSPNPRTIRDLGAPAVMSKAKASPNLLE